jgi:uncharacterized membrane protein
MDSNIRLLTKAVTWQVSAASGGIAIAGTIIGFIAYFIHELAWSKIVWGLSKR